MFCVQTKLFLFQAESMRKVKYWKEEKKMEETHTKIDQTFLKEIRYWEIERKLNGTRIALTKIWETWEDNGHIEGVLCSKLQHVSVWLSTWPKGILP